MNDKHLYEINRIKDVLVSAVPNRHPVRAGDIVAAARIIPLYIKEKDLKKVERVGEKGGVIRISPFKSLNVGLVITGSEVYTGRVADGSSAVEAKVRGYGLNLLGKTIVPDEIPLISGTVLEFFDKGADVVITTAGLSVDPDDVTKEGDRGNRSGGSLLRDPCLSRSHVPRGAPQGEICPRRPGMRVSQQVHSSGYRSHAHYGG